MDIKKLNEAIEKVLNEVKVYNGSAVNYDKLSYKMIGQGEGHASHGWGFYFAVNKDIADQYRETGLSEETISFFGKTYVVNDVRGFVDRYIDHNNEALDIVLKYCLNRLKRNEEFNIKDLIDKLNSNINYYRNEHQYLDQLQDNLNNVIKDIENYKAPSPDVVKEIEDSIEEIKNNDKFKDFSDVLISNLQMDLNKLKLELETHNDLLILQDRKEKLIRDIGKILNNDRNHNKTVNDTQDMISFIEKHKNEFNKENIFINSENQGIVKEFEIPEGPYLEEDKQIKEQSSEVKKALFNLCNQLHINEEEQNKLFNQNGRDLYKDLCNYIREEYGYQYQVSGKGKRADKIVSRLLWKNGIKGIHYFGEDDGECYVLFNSNDVKEIK